MVMEAVELRCEDHPRRLLGRLLHDGAERRVVPGNLLEFACRDCARARRRDGQDVVRVLHRFDLTGELIETVTVADPG